MRFLIIILTFFSGTHALAATELIKSTVKVPYEFLKTDGTKDVLDEYGNKKNLSYLQDGALHILREINEEGRVIKTKFEVAGYELELYELKDQEGGLTWTWCGQKLNSDISQCLVGKNSIPITTKAGLVIGHIYAQWNYKGDHKIKHPDLLIIAPVTSLGRPNSASPQKGSLKIELLANNGDKENNKDLFWNIKAIRNFKAQGKAVLLEAN